MHIKPVPHPWDLPPKEAVAVQKALAAMVRIERPPVLRFIAGVDCAFGGGARCHAAAVLWDLERRMVVEQVLASAPLTFPYVPGLLSFREAPAILSALARLRQEPDAILCDGQGQAHPRRFGIACHIGVLTNKPAVGCGKTRLVGEFAEPGLRRGAAEDLVYQGEVVGKVLRTRDQTRPLFISVGHRFDLSAACETVLMCAVRYRLPEPVRLADRLVATAVTHA